MRLLGRLLATLVAAAAGIVVAVMGAFVQAKSVHVLGLSVPLGVPLALAGLGAVLVLTGMALRSRLVLLGPALGWVIGVFPLAVPREEGDLIVAGTLSGYTFLLGGALLIGICLTLPFEGPPQVPVDPAPVGERQKSTARPAA